MGYYNVERHNIKTNLKWLRNRKALTIKAFSEQVGIKQGTYSVFESYGEGISSERLKIIYDFYGITENDAIMKPEDFIKRFESC